MQTLNYEMVINAPIQKIWDLLFNAETYSQWTKYFSEGNQLKSDWEINGKTYFLDANGDGMVSTIIALNEPFEVVFSHLGLVNNGVENIVSREIKEWSGKQEKYYLRAIDEHTTELRAIVHAAKNDVNRMNEGFNKGFEMIKNLAEKNS